jgi:peptidoglycan/LPS O-acetylase OafA/YrhL
MRRRLEFLDALRGLAATYVLLYHLVLLPEPDLVPPLWSDRLVHAGGTGVTLFFLVSAFSLYYTMPLRLREANPTVSFYLHRFFRIAPLFYFVVIATLVRDWFEFGVGHSVAEIGLSASFLFNLMPTMEQGFVWVSWTIGVEMLFYAIFPILYARVKSLENGIALVMALLMLWITAKMVLAYLTIPEAWKQSILQWSVLRHLPIFAMGIVAYHAFIGTFPSADQAPEATRAKGNSLLWCGIFAYSALLQGWLPDIFGDSYYWQGIIYGIMFLGLALNPWGVVVNRVTCYLGKISYSVYLIHTSVIYFMVPVYRWIYGNLPSVTLCFLACVAVTLAIVIPLSELTYRFVELPGVKLGKRIAAGMRDRAAHRALDGGIN